MRTVTKSLRRAMLLFLCESSLLFLGTDAVKSKYACQNEKLRLRCEDQYLIRIYAAKYGRLEPGTSICPHQNISTQNCEAPNVLLKMTTKCANRQRCTVKADNALFGNPCPGTYKYLDVVYGCVWEPTTATKRINHRTTTEAITTNRAVSLSTETTTTTTKTTTTTTPPKTQRISRQSNVSGTTTNTTANITATRTNITATRTNITATRSWISKVTTKESTTTTSPPEAPKDSKSKASARRGNPGDTLVVFLSSVAGGTIVLLALLLVIFIGKKLRRKKKFAMKRKKADKADEGNKIKSVMIEIQGNDEETKEINVNPGDIIIIDHNDANQSGSEDLGYISEIVRFYNSQNIGSDDQISIRKQFYTCDSPSVISTSDSRDSKYDSAGMSIKPQCTCQQRALLPPSSPLGII